MANSVDPDEMPHSAASDLIWVNTVCSGPSIPIFRVTTELLFIKENRLDIPCESDYLYEMSSLIFPEKNK